MRLRPLCIDYRARALDVIALECDARARGAAPRMALPNPPPSPRPSSRGDESGDSSDDDKENSPASETGGNDQPNDERGDPAKTSAEARNFADRDKRSRRRIRSILQTLGPAVHPSECASRQVDRPSRGPVRGRRLPAARARRPLEKMTMRHIEREGMGINAVVGSMESGRSRLGPGGSIVELFSNSMPNARREPASCAKDTTFVDTMRVVFTKSAGGRPEGDLSCPDREGEDALINRIWSEHTEGLPMAESPYLDHEPVELVKIYRLKSSRSSTSTFAEDISALFGPRLVVPKTDGKRPMMKARAGFPLVPVSNEDPGRISTRPKFSVPMPANISALGKRPDYPSRLNSVPFTRFLNDGHDADADRDEKNLRSNDRRGRGSLKPAPCTKRKRAVRLSNPLALKDNTPSLNVQVDPLFDPLYRDPPRTKRKSLHELLRPPHEICSAISMSTRLRFPGLFEEQHGQTAGLSRFLYHQGERFGFLDESLKNFEESVSRDLSPGLLLAVVVARSRMDEMKLFTQTICLDADIGPPSPLREEGRAPRPDGNEILGPSIEKLPPFSGLQPFSNIRPFSNMLPFSVERKDAGAARSQRGSGCHVESSNPLKSVLGPGRAGCLFLRQVRTGGDDALSDRKTFQSIQQKSVRSALKSAIRSCVPWTNIRDGLALLQGQCTAYPIAPWFECEITNDAPSKPTELDSTILNLKRKMFCRDAKARSNGEGSRCMLLTGCSFRRNAESKCSYRGFLTNLTVDPGIFQLRYIAMVEASRGTKRRVTMAPSRPFFAAMAMGALAEAFARRKSIDSRKIGKSRGANRGAPCAPWLKTKRHGEDKIPSSKLNEVAKASPNSKSELTAGSKMTGLESSVGEGLAQGDSFVFCGAGAARNLVEALGKRATSDRDELLHLVKKARELEKAVKACLAELSVVNRGRIGTPKLKRIPPEGARNSSEASRGEVSKEDGYLPPHQAETVDLAASNDNRPLGKRKASSELVDSEQIIDFRKDKRGKKWSKKEKKAKKRQKHKKKRRNATRHEDGKDPVNSPKKLKAAKATARERNQSMHVALPAIPIDMTPINPPQKADVPNESNGQASRSKLFEASLGNWESKDVVERVSTAKSKSPDSVADLSNGMKAKPPSRDPERTRGWPYQQSPRKDNVDFKQYNEDGRGAAASPQDSIGGLCINNVNASRVDKCGSDISPQKEEPSTNREKQPVPCEEEPKLLHSNPNTPARKTKGPCPLLTLLTSESFLETFGETVAELANGRWRKTLSDSENDAAYGFPKEIVTCDCPLLDIVGVDIELADNSAIVVQFLSCWSEANQDGSYGGNLLSVHRGARAFIRRLVLLAASGRYNAIHAILCLDTEMSTAFPEEISTMQNAMIRQSGCPCEHVTFEFVAPRALAASIALRSASVSTKRDSSRLAVFLSDENIQERARFLIMLVPSMTLHTALHCLGFSTDANDMTVVGSFGSKISLKLQNLFFMAKSTSRDLFPYKVESVMSSVCAKQLWLALNVDLSHAYPM